MKLRELGEFGLIDRIASRVSGTNGVVLGIGDDAAALLPTAGRLTLVTTDMLVEGIHFDLSLTDPYRLGRKSLAVNLSDVAAMGGEPRQAFLSLAIPATLSVEFIDRFMEGFFSRADEFGVALAGGDTCGSAGGLTVSVTLLGEQLPDLVVRRDGARPGDLIFVTGTVGDSALGLELLRRGVRDESAVMRHLDPCPRVREGMTLAAARLATAMIDISDGLLADLGHIARRSGVGATIRLADLPLSSSFRDHAPSLSAEPFSLPLAGGEDYELLFTAPPEARPAIAAAFSGRATTVTAVGEITAARDVTVLGMDGCPYLPDRLGYNHFAIN